MIKKIFAWIGGVVIVGALGLAVACAVSEPVRNWTMDRLGIERVVEDETPSDETPSDEATDGTEDEGITDVPTQPSTGEDELDIPTA